MIITLRNIQFEDAKYFGTRGFIIKLLFFIFVFLFCYLSFLLVSYSASLQSDVDYYMGDKEIDYSFYEHFYNYFNTLYAAGFLLFSVFLGWILKNKKIFMRLVAGHILLVGACVNFEGFSALLFTIWYPYSIFLTMLFPFFALIGMQLTVPYYDYYRAKRRHAKRRYVKRRKSGFSKLEIILIVLMLLVFAAYILYEMNELPEDVYYIFDEPPERDSMGVPNRP